MNTKELLKEARAKLAEAKQKRMSAVTQAPSQAPANKSGREGIMKMALRFGQDSVEKLLAVNTADPKFGYLPAEERQKLLALKEEVDILVAMSHYFKKPVQELDYFKTGFQSRIKAFGIESGDSGFEWIPTMVAQTYVEEYNLPRKVSGLFMDVRMPSNPYKWPVMTNGPVAKRVAAMTGITGQTFDTSKGITFDAGKLTNQCELPEELNEDSAPDMIRALRMTLVSGQEKAVEIAILEGDQAGTMHYFSQLPDVAPGTTIASIVTSTCETEFTGLRKRILAAHALVPNSSVVDGGNNALHEGELSACRAKLGKFGVDPSELVVIPGVKGYNQMLQLDDVRTMDSIGPAAVVLTGQLGVWEGAPVVPSEYVREDCAASGKNTVTTADNTRMTIFMVNRKRFFTATRRAIQILVEKNRTQLDVLDLVSFQRRAFEGVLKADATNYAAESSAAAVINIGA